MSTASGDIRLLGISLGIHIINDFVKNEIPYQASRILGENFGRTIQMLIWQHNCPRLMRYVRRPIYSILARIVCGVCSTALSSVPLLLGFFSRAWKVKISPSRHSRHSYQALTHTHTHTRTHAHRQRANVRQYMSALSMLHRCCKRTQHALRMPPPILCKSLYIPFA